MKPKNNNVAECFICKKLHRESGTSLTCDIYPNGVPEKFYDGELTLGKMVLVKCSYFDYSEELESSITRTGRPIDE